MELVGDGAAGVRLKLHFEDTSILNVQQVQEGLSDSWFLLGRHFNSISDLASHIVVAFGLLNSCPHGISLRMEGFMLPPSQPIWLLKDKDIVSVNKRSKAPHHQVKHACSSSFDTFEKIAPHGVKTRALEEFEREIGGYESEQEEEENALQSLQKDVGGKALKASPIRLKRKKRKREKMERADEQGFMKLPVVPYTGGLIGEKENEKRPKKQKLVMQQDYNDKGCPKDEKGQEPEISKALKIKKKKKDRSIADASVKEMQPALKGNSRNVSLDTRPDAIKTERRKREKASKVNKLIDDSSVEKQHTLKSGNKNVSLCTSDSSPDEKKDEEKKPGLHVEGENVKKCSRSTLRKKAKRRWKRENGGLAVQALQSNKLGDSPRKVAASKDGAEQCSLAVQRDHEDDGDAEEERLPQVVRPGHVRFEPLDEDDDDGLHSQHPLPLLGWSNGISKRKGQSWGQEKAKKGSKNFEVVDEMEICDTQELKLDTLPALKCTPQNGDVIAYRIVELTPSFCPELSEYRVGKVVGIEGHSGTIKLAEVPEYPLWCRHGDHEPDTNEDLSFSSLYDQDGFLETQISSLTDIRMVEGHSHETCKIAPELATTNNDTSLHMITADMKVDTSKTCSTSPNSSKPHSPTEGESSPSLQGWLEISEVLERKKEELARKESITVIKAIEVDTKKSENGSSSTGNNSKKEFGVGDGDGNNPIKAIEVDKAKNGSSSKGNISKKLFGVGDGDGITPTKAIEVDKTKNENGLSSAGNNSLKNANTGRRVKGWHKKAGGLGSTMALLRSQNVL